MGRTILAGSITMHEVRKKPIAGALVVVIICWAVIGSLVVGHFMGITR